MTIFGSVWAGGGPVFFLFLPERKAEMCEEYSTKVSDHLLVEGHAGRHWLPPASSSSYVAAL